MMKLLLFCALFYFALADNEDSSQIGVEPPSLEHLNDEEREAAEELWTSFTDLKDVHEDGVDEEAREKKATEEAQLSEIEEMARERREALRPVDFSAEHESEVETQKEAPQEAELTPTEEINGETLTVVAPFSSTVPPALRDNPPPPQPETGIPNGFYGRSRAFL
ncbi:hypothetical protein cyc_07242 [Cyclospora cayetanensis]|uniref:Uncharacterized protein n=1 Tax=Cyclospora cayetanensis TaxID=88456 RepID=A0A1D3D5B5_9EIME|nr:hypothetical protein cyc_07242 [Cyclospora cayetanensis]